MNGSIHAARGTTATTSSNTPKPPANTTTSPKNTTNKAAQPSHQEPNIPQNPNSSFHPSRMVVQFPPHGLPIDKRPDPGLIVDGINTALSKNNQAKHLKVVAANFNNQGNLIVSTRSDQTADQLIKFQNLFYHIFTDLYQNQEVLLREDKKWYKIQIDGVNTGSLTIGNGRVLHSADSVHMELMSCNPNYTNAQKHIVAKPRWLRSSEELSSTPKSSLVIALTDKPTAR